MHEFTCDESGDPLMTLLKILTLGTSSLMGLALAAALPPEPASPPKEPPPPKSKKKDERGPGGELKKTYDLLRRVALKDLMLGGLRKLGIFPCDLDSPCKPAIALSWGGVTIPMVMTVRSDGRSTGR